MFTSKKMGGTMSMQPRAAAGQRPLTFGAGKAPAPAPAAVPPIGKTAPPALGKGGVPALGRGGLPAPAQRAPGQQTQEYSREFDRLDRKDAASASRAAIPAPPDREQATRIKRMRKSRLGY